MRRFFPGGRRNENRTRINQHIRVPEIRVILDDGTQLGILRTPEALRRAQDDGLDLVEISPTAKPPVCKIMDFGKFKYEEEKKKREAKKKQTVVKTKEIKLRPSTDRHDIEVKLRHIREFLQEGNKAKITIKFRGREMAHKDLGMATLQGMIKELEDMGKVDQTPKMEGKLLSAIIAPLPHAAQKKGEHHAEVKNEQGS